MKSRHLLILFLVLVTLFAIVKGVEFLRGDVGQVKVRNFVSIKAEAFNQIEITNKGTTVILKKNGETWYLTSPLSYLASDTNVSALVSRLADIKSDNIVSTNKDKQTTYAVDTTSGVQVVLKKGESEVLDFVVGKSTTDGNHTYMRKTDSSEIHSVRGSLNSFVAKDIKEWRDKTILKLNSDELSQINIIRSDVPGYMLDKDDSGLWTIIGNPGVLDTTKVDSLLAYLSVLNAADFNDSAVAGELGFAAPGLEIKILTAAGEEYALTAVQTDTKVYVQLNGQGQIYEITKAVFDNLNKQPVDLVAATVSTAP